MELGINNPIVDILLKSNNFDEIKKVIDENVQNIDTFDFVELIKPIDVIFDKIIYFAYQNDSFAELSENTKGYIDLLKHLIDKMNEIDESGFLRKKLIADTLNFVNHEDVGNHKILSDYLNEVFNKDFLKLSTQKGKDALKEQSVLSKSYEMYDMSRNTNKTDKSNLDNADSQNNLNAYKVNKSNPLKDFFDLLEKLLNKIIDKFKKVKEKDEREPSKHIGEIKKADFYSKKGDEQSGLKNPFYDGL